MGKTILLSILFLGMTISLDAQWTISQDADWTTSRFFQHENKSGYAVSFLTKGIYPLSKMYPLSKEDTKTIIDILSAYNWEENREQHEEAVEMYEGGYYFYSYYISITHPDKRKVTLRINSGGIGKDEFLIEYSTGKPFGTFRFNSYFPSDDTEKIKQLFFKYNVDFNSITFKKNEPIKIEPAFGFHNVFYLKIPPVSLDTTLTKEFIRLYNSGWNSRAPSGDGDPVPIWNLYTSYHSISYDNVFVFDRYPDDLISVDFKDADKQALIDLINKALTRHNGEGEHTSANHSIKIRVYYQYKDGLLHGQVKVFMSEKLTNEFFYDKGLPVSYIKYTDEGTKEKEIHFYPADMSLVWTEYDDEGNAKDSGKSHYRIRYNKSNEIENFYKSNK